jgi:hypothetical protein
MTTARKPPARRTTTTARTLGPELREAIDALGASLLAQAAVGRAQEGLDDVRLWAASPLINEPWRITRAEKRLASLRDKAAVALLASERAYAASGLPQGGRRYLPVC